MGKLGFDASGIYQSRGTLLFEELQGSFRGVHVDHLRRIRCILFTPGGLAEAHRRQGLPAYLPHMAGGPLRAIQHLGTIVADVSNVLMSLFSLHLISREMDAGGLSVAFCLSADRHFE
jgi:hypothetical protein